MGIDKSQPGIVEFCAASRAYSPYKKGVEVKTLTPSEVKHVQSHSITTPRRPRRRRGAPPPLAPEFIHVHGRWGPVVLIFTLCGRGPGADPKDPSLVFVSQPA